MIEELLGRIGLTEGEIKVYTALLSIGESTVGPICAKSKVSKSKVYDILSRLIDKGLVGHITRDNVKCFTANDPSVIQDYLARKQDDLARLSNDATRAIPLLSALNKQSKNTQNAEIYQGFNGLKAIRDQLISTLSKGDEFLVFGAPRIANEKWEAYFWSFHKKREARGVSMRILYNANARPFGEKRKRFKLTCVRYLPSGIVSPNWIDIFSDSVLIVLILKTGPISIVIRDKSIAESFREYFNIIWKTSKA